MNDQLARNLFMDYLYDEISSEKRKELELYLQVHPELQEELQKLEQTRTLLQRMPSEQPDQKLLVMEPRTRSFSNWLKEARTLLPHSFLGKTGFAVAASIVLLMIIGSVAKIHVAPTEAGYSVSFGYQPVVNEGFSAQQAETFLSQIRDENAALLTEYMQAINDQNNEQLRQVVRYFEQQRMNDLQLIDHNLEQVQQTSNYRWQQANRFLGEVLQNVNLNEND
ncbi:MAG: anti-sigma factor family protein [Candidatus Halalkalibacterium sp. M3_1C_030]